MKKKDNYTSMVIKGARRELIYKIITSIFIRGLLLVIPVFWSNTVNNLSEGNLSDTYYLIVVIIFLSIFYYVWQYLNQVSWYQFYDKLSLGYTSLITDDNRRNIEKVSLGEYTNVINNDIDILGNCLGNGVARGIQVLEIFVIYFYFITINGYIFLVTLLVSVLMIILLVISSGQIKMLNVKRKSSLDKKTVVAQQLYESLRENNCDEKMFRKFYLSHLDYLRANKSFNLLSMALIYLILGIIELVKYGVIIYCVYLINRDVMAVGTIVLVYTYFDKIITNFEVLGTISAEYQSFLVSLKRLNKLGNSQDGIEV